MASEPSPGKPRNRRRAYLVAAPNLDKRFLASVTRLRIISPMISSGMLRFARWSMAFCCDIVYKRSLKPQKWRYGKSEALARQSYRLGLEIMDECNLEMSGQRPASVT